MSKYLGGLVTATINPLGKKPTDVEYLVVAGGGGGGARVGGGGGAGGFLTATNFAVEYWYCVDCYCWRWRFWQQHHKLTLVAWF
jgi:hypothetical protein